MFVAPGDFHTPAGAVTLRGAWNFRTPQGWDTVYAPVFNMVERPIAPMLVVRVETDWYAHETEFRYVLQPGETLTGSATNPIGQAFFLPRTDVTLRDSDAAELREIAEFRQRFLRDKAADQLHTGYGLPYSPLYLKMSRAQAGTSSTVPPPASSDTQTGEPVPVEPLRVQRVAGPAAQPSDPARGIGRNDPCSCGSGKKYKRCHGDK